MEKVVSGSNGKVREIDLGDDFGDVVLKVNHATIAVGADGRVTLGGAALLPAPVNDTSSTLAHEIGAIENTGEHKGEIYGGILPSDNNPIWFSAAPTLMDHYAAATWAREQGGALPTRKQGAYLTTLKDKLEICPAPRAEMRCLKDCPEKRDGPDGGGAFTELFNRGSSFPADYVWLAEPVTDPYCGGRAWCQRLGDGYQTHIYRTERLPALCVFR
jgi:hypothetical protein